MPRIQALIDLQTIDLQQARVATRLSQVLRACTSTQAAASRTSHLPPQEGQANCGFRFTSPSVE